jgi:hypothetical protein
MPNIARTSRCLACAFALAALALPSFSQSTKTQPGNYTPPPPTAPPADVGNDTSAPIPPKTSPGNDVPELALDASGALVALLVGGLLLLESRRRTAQR